MFYGMCPNCYEEFTKPKKHDLCEECRNIPVITRLRKEARLGVRPPTTPVIRTTAQQSTVEILDVFIKMKHGNGGLIWLWTAPFAQAGVNIDQLHTEILDSMAFTGSAAVTAARLKEKHLGDAFKNNYATLMRATGANRKTPMIKIRVVLNKKAVILKTISSSFQFDERAMSDFCLKVHNAIKGGASLGTVTDMVNAALDIDETSQVYFTSKTYTYLHAKSPGQPAIKKSCSFFLKQGVTMQFLKDNMLALMEKMPAQEAWEELSRKLKNTPPPKTTKELKKKIRQSKLLRKQDEFLQTMTVFWGDGFLRIYHPTSKKSYKAKIPAPATTDKYALDNLKKIVEFAISKKEEHTQQQLWQRCLSEFRKLYPL